MRTTYKAKFFHGVIHSRYSQRSYALAYLEGVKAAVSFIGVKREIAMVETVTLSSTRACLIS